MATAKQVLEMLDIKFREATLNKHRFANNPRQHAHYARIADSLAVGIVCVEDGEVDDYGMSFRMEECT